MTTVKNADRVVIRHPETGGMTTVTQRAFDLAWSKRNWEVVTDATQVKKDQLLAVAERVGRHVNPSDPKAEILGQLTDQEG